MTGGGQKIRIKNVSSLRINAFESRKRGEKSPQCFVISPHILTKRRGVCIHSNQHNEKLRITITQVGKCTKIGDFIEAESVLRRDKGGKASARKFVTFKHLPKSSARKERKHSSEFEKVYTFAAQRGAKTTKTPPRPLHYP